MTKALPPQPKKRPRQSRSQMLVRAVREACVKVLESEGPDKLTTQRIADVAGVNIASVYQYFPNKEAVLAEVYTEQIAALSEEAGKDFHRIQQLSEQSLEATLQAIIAMEARFLSRLYQLSPNFYLQYESSFDILQRVNEFTQAQSNPSWQSWFPDFLRRHQARLREGDIDTMAFIARQSMESCLRNALYERPAALGEDTFLKEVLVLLQRYLLR